MKKPIPDKAEVAIDFPDKYYMGTFERTARFEAKADPTGVALTLERSSAPRRTVSLHLHYDLFAEILEGVAATTGAIAADDQRHRERIAAACDALRRALAS
jgi:hypothetical protein